METKFTIVEIGVPLISFILAFVFITIVIAKKFIRTKISEYGRRHVALRDIQKDFRNTVSDNQNKIDQLSSESAAISNTIQSLRSEIFNHEEEINSLSLEKRHISDDVKQRRPMYEQLMKDLKDLETRRDTLKKDNKELLFQIENKGKLESDVSFLKERRGKLDSESRALKIEISDVRKKLKELISELDLYSQQDEFANQGHYEMPEYLYESSERYKHEIKRERETQKSLISSGRAVLNLPNGNSDTDQQLVIPQSKLLLRTFNIECDLLFGKIKHSNYARTITRVESLANSLEKQLTDLNVGFNLEFIKSKLKECTLIYHEKLKAKEEQEKQKLHRAELAEEAKAQREYKAALKKAQLEEETYNNLLEQARAELLKTSQENMAEQQDRIKYLEQKLSEAKDQEERAKSMAQITKCGYIYVISNPGSFGEGVYKIGLTRRLDPLDRVKELGDASVPFPFDIHGIIYSQDAPNLESSLHNEFTKNRVNIVNHRKEFFKVDLKSIERTINTLVKDKIELSEGTGHDGDYEEVIRMRNKALNAHSAHGNVFESKDLS